MSAANRHITQWVLLNASSCLQTQATRPPLVVVTKGRMAATCAPAMVTIYGAELTIF